MKKLLLSAAAFAVVAVSAVTVAPTTSEAVPGYARQTGAACLSCHFQAIPRLAAFGRNFKMNGMRDMGEGALIEDDHLSLPASFNASFMFKARIRKSSTAAGGNWGGKAAWQWPDESAIFIGGRYGEHIGAMTEIDTNQGAGVAHYKVAYVFDTDNGPVVVAWGDSSGHGPAFILNDPSNTVIRNTRGWFQRLSALDTSSISGNAYGGGIYAVLNDMFYIGAGMFGQAGSANAPGSNYSMSTMGPHFRAALITELAGFDTVAGLWYGRPVTGVAPAAGAVGAAAVSLAKSQKGTSFGLDLQMQGEMGDLLVGFYCPVVLKGKQAGQTAVAWTDNTGYYPTVIVSMGHMGARFGWRHDKSEMFAAGVATSSTTSGAVFGAWYSLAQNFELIVEYHDAKTKTGAAAATHNKLWTFLWEYVY